MRPTKTLSKYLIQGLTFLTICSFFIACGSTGPKSSSGPGKITVQVLDSGGTLQFVKQIVLNYQKAHPDQFSFQFLASATVPPSVPGKIKAQKAAHKQDISLVLGGYDLVASGIQQGIWQQVLPQFSSQLPDFNSIYQDPVKQFASLANGYAVPVVYTPGESGLPIRPEQSSQSPTDHRRTQSLDYRASRQV